MNGIGRSGRSNSEPHIPFLVKIQTIDVEALDFRSSVGKKKQVTFVDGTSRFIFVGCTSGTVYVFSRDTLQFLLIIPFKGGKVCSVASTEDESDVAVGSLRGQVSIYRLLKARNTSIGNSKSGPLPVSVKQLYSVNHHNGNEITEMQWSPNGRYLFIGDNQGLISQVDVGSLEEFPRPPPSRVILQVQSRVLQLDCIFPFLAVNTLSGVFLCDIENEDFTRIHSANKRSILATGVSLALTEDERAEDLPPVTLYIAPQNSSTILRYGIQGNLIQSLDFQDKNICPKEVPLFDPKKEVKTNSGDGSDFRVTFGKLYASDEGYLISASHHRIIFLDPGTARVICWNDDFRRISTLKVLSNYLFVWESNKLHVVALSSFQAYGMQLIGAGLTGILQNWITHCLNAIGWTEEFQQSFKTESVQTSSEKTEVRGENEENSEDSQDLPVASENLEVSEGFVEETELLARNPEGPEVMLEEFRVPEVPSENLEAWTKNPEDGSENGGMDPEEIQRIQSRFTSLLKYPSLIQEDLKNFTLENVPKPLQESLLKLFSEDEDEFQKIPPAVEEPPNPILIAVTQLLSALENVQNLGYKSMKEALGNFYEQVQVQLPNNVENTDEDSVIFKQSLFQSKMTFDSLIQSCTSFLRQSPLKAVQAELRLFKSEKEKLEQLVRDFLYKLVAGDLDPKEMVADEDASNLLILNFGKQNSVKKWFTEFKVSGNVIQNDTYIAEVVLLLLPLLDSGLTSGDLLLRTKSKFFTWLVFFINATERRTLVFGRKLHEFLSAKVRGNFINEVISAVYEDLLKSPEVRRAEDLLSPEDLLAKPPLEDLMKSSEDLLTGLSADHLKKSLAVPLPPEVSSNQLSPEVSSNQLPPEVLPEDLNPKPPEDPLAIHFIHHFASLLQLKSSSKNSKSKILSSLITNFPLKNYGDLEIKSAVLNLLRNNPMLLEMFSEGCLTDGNSQPLCKCGLPAFFGLPTLFMIPRTQRLIEESILEILLTKKSNNKNNSWDKGSKGFRFAMKRLLLDKYLEISKEGPSSPEDSVKIEIILRSGECHLLQKHVGFSLKRLQILKDFYSQNFHRSETCSCGVPLERHPNFRLISWDCIGLWILGDSTLSANEPLTRIIHGTDLNTPGIFSLAFYGFLADSEQEAFDEDSIGFESARRIKAKNDNRSVCAAFH